MRILSISDRVETTLYPELQPQTLPDIDLILACGDLPPEYLSYLMEKLDVPLYYVCGNHDIRYAQNPPPGCRNIHNRVVRHGGIRLLGLEGSRWYNGGPYQYTEHEMRSLVRRLWLRSWFHGTVDIIITHAPPRHVGDAEDRCHRGFKSYGTLIRRYAPRYLIHGHIHANFTQASQRVTKIDQTNVVNTYGCFIFKID